MKKWFPDRNEFYIGYLPNAPDSITRVIRIVILLLGIISICLAALLAWHQKKFSPASFEYGVNTDIEGFIFEHPIPHVLIPLGRDQLGQQLYQTVLLVGFGKSGSQNAMHQILKSGHGPGTKARLNGSLIYGDGKTLIQIDNASDITLIEGQIDHVAAVQTDENLSITGEIVDPKCYFGVMKPGEGKAHRACAIRCIAGGIPPVFNGGPDGYYLLVDENSKPISTEVANIVGDVISLSGRRMHWNDWTILQIDSRRIDELSAAKRWRENLLAFEQGMTQCN